jgi:hypothetical protein
VSATALVMATPIVPAAILAAATPVKDGERAAVVHARGRTERQRTIRLRCDGYHELHSMRSMRHAQTVIGVIVLRHGVKQDPLNATSTLDQRPNDLYQKAANRGPAYDIDGIEHGDACLLAILILLIAMRLLFMIEGKRAQGPGGFLRRACGAT